MRASDTGPCNANVTIEVDLSRYLIADNPVPADSGAAINTVLTDTPSWAFFAVSEPPVTFADLLPQWSLQVCWLLLSRNILVVFFSLVVVYGSAEARRFEAGVEGEE